MSLGKADFWLFYSGNLRRMAWHLLEAACEFTRRGVLDVKGKKNV